MPQQKDRNPGDRPGGPDKKEQHPGSYPAERDRDREQNPSQGGKGHPDRARSGERPDDPNSPDNDTGRREPPPGA